jgi:hypothetical protein
MPGGERISRLTRSAAREAVGCEKADIRSDSLHIHGNQRQRRKHYGHHHLRILPENQ